MIYQGRPHLYGIDFAGGDQVTAQFTQKIDTAKIREIANANRIGEISLTYTSDLGSGKEQLQFETAYGKSRCAFLATLQKAYPSAGLEKIGNEPDWCYHWQRDPVERGSGGGCVDARDSRLYRVPL